MSKVTSNVNWPDFRELASKVDATRLCLAVAQDVAGRIRQNIKERRITPPIKPATVARKAQDPATARGAAGVTLMHTGLLHDNIRARTSGKNRAVVEVQEKRYDAQARVSSLKTRKERWKKHSKAEQAKRDAGKKRTPPLTTEVAAWHNVGAGNLPKREFWKLPEDLERIVRVRVQQWIVGAKRRLGL